MSTLKIYDNAGECVGEMPFATGGLAEGKGAQAVHDAVVTYLANQRAGTAATLSKGAVAGSNRKPWRQKGTGRARAGYRQSPLWRGGGVAFGPRPRSFRRGLPKGVARLAFRRAFSDRVEQGAVRVVAELPEMAQPKTRLMVEWMKRQGVDGPTLLIGERISDPIRLAARNVPGIELATAGHVNTYQILRYPTILILQEAMPSLNKRLGAEDDVS